VSVDVTIEELHDPGYFQLSATLTDEQSPDEVKSILLQTLRTLATEGPTAEEMERTRTRIIQGMDRTMANSAQLALQMTEVIASGDWRLLFTNYEQLKRVTAGDVKRVAQQYFKDSNRTAGVFRPDPAPDRTIVPETPGIETLLTTFNPVITVESGEALDPSPESLEKRIQRSTLASGFRIALLPKATRGGRVQASLTLRFGDETSLARQNAAAELTAALLMRGTKSRTRQQVQDRLQELNATISIRGGEGRGDSLANVTASISTTAQNLVPALRLAVEILREPALLEADFDQIRSQLIARAERGRSEPTVLVPLAMQRHLSPYPRDDVRYVRTIDEEVEDLTRLTVENVRSFHQTFYGASHGELVVVGRFDPAEVSTVAGDLLGSWKTGKPYTPITAAFKEVPPIETKIETPDKENAQLFAGLRLRLRDTDSDYPAMVMASYMFGSGGLSSRLPNRIRNVEGLSYTVSSNFTAPVLGDAAALSAAAIANPRNIPQVQASLLDELARTLRDGFTVAELSAAKRAFLDSRIGSRSSDGGLMNLIAAREQYGRTLMWDEQLETNVAALALDQVNAAFRRHVNAAAMAIVKGGDFKAANVLQ
jgi:zinc protease